MQKYMESMRFSGLELPRGTKLWIHDEHFLATAELSYKVGVPHDFFRGFAPSLTATGPPAAIWHGWCRPRATGFDCSQRLRAALSEGFRSGFLVCVGRVLAIRSIGIPCLILNSFVSNLGPGSSNLQ